MSIKLKGSSDGSVSLDAPADTSPSGSDITLTLPTSAGSANQFLKNSGIAGELEYSSMLEDSSGVATFKGGTVLVEATSNTTNAQLSLGRPDSTSAGYIRYINNDNAMAFRTNGSGEDMRLDSSGRLLVGTPSSLYNNAFLQVVGPNSNTYISMTNTTEGNTDGSGYNYIHFRRRQAGGTESSSARIGSAHDGTLGNEKGRLMFFTNDGNDGNSPTERMRITSDGTVLLNGQTSNPTGATTSLYTNSAGNFSEGITIKSPIGSGNRFMIGFYNNSNNKIGDIVYNGTNTLYNQTSDYRLKENVVAITDGITRIKQLKPSRFNFIGNTETTVDGFLAHEVQGVVAAAVTGDHDAVDDNGNPVYQSIDQSMLVPLLTAALQEAIAKIETLETKVAVLEAA